jgi:S-DNA-T family DNA segregation ATPase FtsK/SpoIIIE
MARKDPEKPSRWHGFGDIAGIVMLALAVLLLVAMMSFDRADIAVNRAPTNDTTHNLIGPIGAHLANWFFFWFGAGAFIVPVLLLVGGAGLLFASLAHLRRRWPWALVLFICCIGALDFYTNTKALDQLGRNPAWSGAGFFERTAYNLNSQSAGGLAGASLNRWIFGNLGRVGAPVLYFTLWLISLIFLTNFHLLTWLRDLLHREPPLPEGAENWTPEERSLAKKVRELDNQAKALQQEVAKANPGANLGADLKPVPTPTVRDLSVPQIRSTARPSKQKVPPPTEPDEAPEIVGAEIIPAREVAAATAADVLGKSAGAPAKGAKAAEASPADDQKPPWDEDDAMESTTAVAPVAPPKVAITDNATYKPRPQPKKKPITVASTPTIGNYQLPPMDFFQMPDMTVKPTETKEELMANAKLMQQTLAQFGIEVQLGDITKGPTITRYELHPAPGVKLEKITALNNNLAAALKAERIHILAPVPGKSSVGIEVPNAIKTKVIMRELLESEEWTKTKARIPLALGKDVYGHPIIADLAEMPHLLIAGSTGSGKSVCINSIIASLLYKFPPDKLRFVMIDPKVVELQQYNTLPHLVVPVVTDPKKVILALRWVINEMEKRYQIFAKVGVRNIKSFNERPKNAPVVPPAEPELPLTVKKEKIEPGADGFAVEVDEEIVVPREEDIIIPDFLSYIVVIIDELADLMLVAPADVEMAIARITQMARAAGIHCIVATQRPSVDVITGVIKANIPARIAFQVASRVDSRTILDSMGADKLLGKGDMLYLPPGSARFIRAQGALITDQEIQSAVDFIAKQGKPSYEVEIHQQLSKPVSELNSESGTGEDEEVIQQCIEVIRSEAKASVSLLQRRLRLGYGRAARIMDELEERGIVGPSKGAEPRDILIDLDGGGADGQGQTG